MVRRIRTVVFLVAVAVATATAYQWLRGRIALDVTRDRLATLGREYEQLRRTYNEAVRRTAVTELLVRDGVLSVSIRTAQGVHEQIPTPFDPSYEIYVDYVVCDGRLWIRRVYDEQTAPGEGQVIDPAWAMIDWNAPGVAHGKTVYRQLSEGRWVITVSGDGSLGLALRDDDDITELSPPPPVRPFEPLDGESATGDKPIRPDEVVMHLLRKGS